MDKPKNLSLFLSNSSSTYYINTDLEGTYTFTNSFYRKIFGFDSAEILQTNFASTIHPEDIFLYREAIIESLGHPGKTVCSDLRMPRKDGSLFWVRWEFGAFFDDNNHVVGIQALGNDLTERKRAELGRIEAENNLRLLLDNTNEGFIMVDPQFTVINFNRAAGEQILKFSDQVLRKGSKFIQFEDISQQEEVESLLAKALEGLQQERIFQKNIDDSRVIYSSNYKPVIEEEQVSGIIITFRDITKKVIAEERLQNHERYFRALIENSADAILIVNADNTVADISTSAFRLLGYNAADLLGKTTQDIIYPADLAFAVASFRDVLKSYDAVRTIELRVFDAKKTIRWLSATMNNLLHEPSINGVVINFHDITQRKQAEQALLVSEENYRFLFFSNPQPMWIYDQDTLEFIEVNTAAVEHYGYSREEFFKMSLYDIRPREDWPALAERLERLKSLPAHVSSKKVWRHIKKSGEVIFVEIKSHPVNYSGRHGSLVSVNDLTNMVNAELELMKSNERFSYASKATSDAIWELDLINGDFYISEAISRILGWPVGKFQRFSDLEKLFHPEDQELVVGEFHTRLKDSGLESFTQEFRILRSNGDYAYLTNSAWILRSEVGKAQRLIGSLKDITETKKFQEELLKSNERFELAGQATSDAIWDADLVTDTIHWGEGFETLFGFNADIPSQPADTWIKNVHPEDRARVMESHYNVVFNMPQEKFWQDEYRFIRADGTIAHVVDKGIIIRDEVGRPFRIIGAMRDITQHRESEERLSRERFLLRTLIDNLPDYISVKDRQGRHIISNSSLVRLIGFENEAQTIGHTTPDLLGDNQSRKLEELEQKLMSENRSLLNSEEVFQTPGNQQRWLLTTRVPLRNEQKEVFGLVSISRDITEKRAIEESLRKSLDQFSILSKATNDAVWDWDLKTGKITWNRVANKVFGYDDLENGTDASWRFESIHREDRPRIQREIARHLRLGITRWQAEYRFRCGDGSFKYVFDRGFLLMDENKQAYRMIGAMIDLTERKKLEEELAVQKVNRQRQITEATIQAQEKERTEIGRELHDNINQILTTTKIYLDLAINEEELRGELLEKCYKNVSESIEEIRRLSRSLVPPSLGDIGIREAITEMVNDLSLTQGIKIKFRTSGLTKLSIAPNTKLMLYRVVQEQMNNILKHSQATEAEIKLNSAGKMLHLTISDNGVGFDITKRNKGIGLNNITSRTELHNGRMEIISSPGNGCTLKVSIPV